MPRRREPAERAEAVAVARALADSSGRMERRILEELIYERVRVSVDLCELMTFELDLSASIERALSACAESPGERSELTLEFLERAWDRLSGEVMSRFAERGLVSRDDQERVDGVIPRA